MNKIIDLNTSVRSSMTKDRFSPRPAKKIEKRFVPSSNFFNSIDSEEESLENCFLDVCQQHWEKKRSLIFSIDRKRGLIDPCSHSFYSTSFTIDQNVCRHDKSREFQRTSSSPRSLVGCSTRDSSHHRSNASAHSSQDQTIDHQRSAGAHFNLIHRPLEKHEPETNGNQLSSQFP